MSRLNIPAAAWNAAREAVTRFDAKNGTRVTGRGAVALIVNAAAPHILADELRRLAVEIGPQAGVVDGSDDMTRRACAAALVARADGLDGAK